jgi:glycosyltransferase involved in cell wall biosynthesis
LRICVIGKYPPIQGGVSMRTYWTAHGLAARGHDVHVVTNAKEVRPPFRMHMRAQDWKRCEASYGAGLVMVHWTDPADRSQFHIPMASPFVSKLAAVAAQVHAERPFDIILSYYMEPYGVAGHLASQMTGVPHVARMAGSDAGRLWHHPQFEPLYDHVLRSAEIVTAVGTVAERAIRRGVDPGRIASAGGFAVPEALFKPQGPRLDLARIRQEAAADPALRDLRWGDFTGDRPYFGVYGKLGESKGSFALLAAMSRLKRAGLKFGLVAVAHGTAEVDESFRARARKLGLAGHILQLPFLPHWRMPEFLRGCVAVCCLEQDFPIRFHTPIIAIEVLLCGACLVGSTEIIRKLPGSGRLPDGYGCVAIEDVNDIAALSARLAAILKDPAPAAVVGARGRKFALDLQREVGFPETLERVLAAAAGRKPVTRATQGPPDDQQHIGDASAAAIKVVIAAAEKEADKSGSSKDCDPLFRLRMGRWAMGRDDLAGLVPLRDQRIRVIELDHDLSAFVGARTVAELPPSPPPGRSHVVVFGRSGGGRRSPLIVDAVTARLLDLSDGTRTVSDILRALDRKPGLPSKRDVEWIEHIFVEGLVSLQAKRSDRAIRGRRNAAAARRTCACNSADR